MEKILYFIVMGVFVGASAISIDLGIMHIDLYRLGILLAIFYIVLNNSILSKKDFSLKVKDKQDLIIKFYLFWLVYGVVSMSWVLNFRLGIRALFFLASGLFCIWLFSYFIETKKAFVNILNVSFIMMILHNILGWFEIITMKYFFIDIKKVDHFDRFSYNFGARRPVTTFANTNDFATLMTFSFFLAFILFLNAKKLWIKVLSSATMISSIVLISRSKSRANMLGIILGFAAIFILILYKRLGRKGIFLMALAILMVFIFYPPLIKNIFILIDDKILNTFKEGATSSKSNVTRINLIKNGFVFLRDTFGFGTGAGNIEYWMEKRQVFYVNTVYNIHNWWLEILVGYGLIVFVGYIYIYYLKLKILVKGFLESEKCFIKNTAIGFFGFMVAYTISSLSSSTNIDKGWIWVIWAIIISFIGYVLKDFEEVKGNF